MKKPPQPIDGLCMVQACRGVLLDLHCALDQWADHYEVPSEALRGMVSGLFIFERLGWPPLSHEELVAYANKIIGQESAEEIELTRIFSAAVLGKHDGLREHGDISALRRRCSDTTCPRNVEVLAAPGMAEWISNCAAGRPSGERPRLIGPEFLFDRIKFCRTNIVNLENRLSEESTSGHYEDAEQTCQELKEELHWMAEILIDVQDMDSVECSNEPEESEKYADEIIAVEAPAELGEADHSLLQRDVSTST